MKSFLKLLLEYLYPERCVFCETILPDDGIFICDKCDRLLPRAENPNEKKDIPYLDKCLYCFRYEGIVRESLHRYKFSGHTAHAAAYSAFLSKIVDEYCSDCDIITWVPLSRKRKRARGYDQAMLIAEELAKISGMQCRQFLIKTVNNPAQSGTKGLQERKMNVRGVYAAKNTEQICGKKILLVDDIITTGSTVSECARVLKEAGADEVTALSLAGTVLKGNTV